MISNAAESTRVPSLANPVMDVKTDIAATAQATFTGATLKFNNTTSNQDGCKGATVELSFAAA